LDELLELKISNSNQFPILEESNSDPNIHIRTRNISMDWENCGQSIFLGNHSPKEANVVFRLKKSLTGNQDDSEISNEVDEEILRLSTHNP
jgi:hypothetical protein